MKKIFGIIISIPLLIIADLAAYLYGLYIFANKEWEKQLKKGK